MIRTACLAIAFTAFCGVSAMAQQAISRTVADLRVLDKVTGAVTDLSLPVGTREQVGLLNLSLQDCRVPRVNPNGDAFALLVVTYQNQPDPVFQGWMVASSPALNAMDHPRFDVWLLRCSS